MSGKRKLACPESIADLWGYPDAGYPKRPSTATLLRAIAQEAEACLRHTDWEARIRRIENLVRVIRWRMRSHWEEQLDTELDRLVKKAKEVNGHVG